jgi:two-component system LytT family sensor kinase
MRRLPAAQLRLWGWWLITAFWIVQFAELTTATFAEAGIRSYPSIAPRTAVMVIGALLSLAVLEVVVQSRGAPVRRRVFLVGATALAAWAAAATVNFLVFSIALGTITSADLAGYVSTIFSWSWFFFSMAGALLAMALVLEVAEAERALADVEAVARDARLAVLRYQLNPHFLFNALNSIAALIDAGRGREAERMVEILAEFLRATLDLDPVMDIFLRRELQLVDMYLEIEKVRFPSRLSYTLKCPDDLADFPVPPLITQPLIENAIRHGVAPSKRTTAVSLTVERLPDVVRITVFNDLDEGESHAVRRIGVGVANVRARLATRYADRARFDGRREADGYAAVIDLPLEADPV